MGRRPPHRSSDDDETAVYQGQPRASRDTKRGHEGAPEVHKAIRVISMKTPGVPEDRAANEAQARAVKLRALSEISAPSIQIPLGNLAPPRDEKESARRRARTYVILGVAVVLVGIVVMLGVILLVG